MSSRTETQRQFDRIAAARMRLHEGGLPLHVALGSKPSIMFRFRLRRMGITIEEAQDLVALVDESAIAETMSSMPISVRYATVKREQKRRPVWGRGLF